MTSRIEQEDRLPSVCPEKDNYLALCRLNVLLQKIAYGMQSNRYATTQAERIAADIPGLSQVNLKLRSVFSALSLTESPLAYCQAKIPAAIQEARQQLASQIILSPLEIEAVGEAVSAEESKDFIELFPESVSEEVAQVTHEYLVRILQYTILEDSPFDEIYNYKLEALLSSPPMLALLLSIGLSTDGDELDVLLLETSDNKFKLYLDKLIRQFTLVLYKKEPDEFERDIAAALFESPEDEAKAVVETLPLSIPEEIRKLLADIWVNLDQEDRDLILENKFSAHYDMVTILSRCFSFRSLPIDERKINDLTYDLLGVIRKMAVI